MLFDSNAEIVSVIINICILGDLKYIILQQLYHIKVFKIIDKFKIQTFLFNLGKSKKILYYFRDGFKGQLLKIKSEPIVFFFVKITR